MDQDVASWLASLFQQASAQLEYSPGLIIEVVGNAALWVQVLPEGSESSEKLGGFVFNFPYRGLHGDPLETLRVRGLSIPPGGETLIWEDDGFATIWLRPDTPFVTLASFVGELFDKALDAPSDYELGVRIEYGY